MTPGEEMSGTHDCGGDAAAYALGALEPAEAEAFERHLERCAVCRDETEALRETVAALPMAAPQLPPPRRLRRGVMRALRAGPSPLATRDHASMSRRRRLRSARPVLAALTVALVVAAAGVTGLKLSSRGATERVIAARVTGISGSAQVRVHDGRAELVVRHLSPPPRGHVYEVWLKELGAAPVPASVMFSVNAEGSADVGLPGRMHGVSQILVTPEPHGGSRTPTHQPVIVAALT
jgi:anti-sigma-K factor RskA